MHTGFWSGNLKEEGRFKYLTVGTRIMLKWILINIMGVDFICLMKGTTVKLL
jgi:hypothetical protein